MANQSYGQFCAFSRALEVVGEPWALLIVRDLCVGPKPLTELREGLPGIPAGVLSKRLEELQAFGVLRQRVSADYAGAAVYELTQYGSELEAILLALGRWGAKTLGGPRREEVITADSMVMALRATFRPEVSRGLHISYELRLAEVVVHALVDDGKLRVGKGPLPSADLVIESGPVLKVLMAGEISPSEALGTGGIQLRTGDVRLTADPGLLAWFIEIFHITPAPPAKGHGPMFDFAPELTGDPLHPVPVAADPTPGAADAVPVGNFT